MCVPVVLNWVVEANEEKRWNRTWFFELSTRIMEFAWQEKQGVLPLKLLRLDLHFRGFF